MSDAGTSPLGDLISRSSFLNPGASLTTPQRTIPQLPAITPRMPQTAALGEALMTRTQFATPDVVAGTPINYRLPQYTKKYQQKWANVDPAYGQAAVAAVQKIDATRILRGQPPLTEQETKVALDAAQSRNVPIEQERDPTAIFSNAVKDIGDIGRSIIHLPEALWNEAGQIGNIPDALSKMDGLGDLGTVPVVRMIPGVYTVSNLANGTEGLKEIGRHPLMTALDVLPGAKKLAETAPVVKAAEADRLVALQQAQARSLATGAPMVEPPKVNPFRTLATRTLDANGDVALNRVGQVTDAIAKDTKVGQFLSEAFGPQAREASSMLLHAQRGVENALFDRPEMIPDQFAGHPILDTVRQSAELLTGRAAKDYNLTPQRIAELTDIMSRTPEQIPNLPANELAFVTEIRDLNAQYADYLIGEGKLHRIDGEVYDEATGRRLSNLNRKAQDAEAAFLANRLGRDRGMVIDPATGQPIPQIDPVTGKPLRQRTTLRELAEAPDADPRLWDLYDLVDQGNYREARKLLNGLLRGRTRLGQSTSVGTEGLGGNAPIASLKKIHAELDDLITRQGRYERFKAANPPARFMDLIDRKVGEAVQAQSRNLTPQQAAATAQAIAERRYMDVLPKAEVRKIQADVQGTWEQLKAAGADPVFVHRVSPERASAIRYPRVLPENVSESQIKARTLDMSPSVRDATVAITHQGVEILERAASEQLSLSIIDRWGVKGDALRQELLPVARAQAAAGRAGVDVNTVLSKLINDHYTVFDPESFMGFKSAKLTGMESGDIYIPKSVANTFDRMRKSPSELGALASGPMNVFRTSVLALSPRWHVYNIVGGAMMLQGRTGPGVWKFISKAREAINTGAIPDDLKLALGGAGREIAELNFYKGRTLRRLWDEARTKSPTLDAAAERGSALVRKSYDFNSFFDDTYRVAAYLFGEDKALTAGMSREAAQSAGMALARKVMVNWDAMTPIERGIIKHIFPFYGFTQHMMRYALTFPMDHPFRAAIVGGFARTELEDSKGLPDSFHNALFFGNEDEKGNQTAINVGAANPFADLSSMFTLSGFIGGVNPFISTGLKTIGVDPMTGSAELYPQLRYDPETGVSVAQNDNPLTSFFFNTIPQARSLAALVGASADFNEIRRTNPEAANRMLRSGFGIPIVMRNYNLPQEYAQQTLEMRDAANKAKNLALKTGDDSYVSQFPQLGAYIEQIRKLQAENPTAFAPYATPQPVDGTGDRAVAVLDQRR